MITVNHVNSAKAESGLNITPIPVPYFPPQTYSPPTFNYSPLVNDAIMPSDVIKSYERVVHNVQVEDPRPGFWETSEYMMGRVGVLIVFVESDGMLDPSTENWTPERMEQVEVGIYRALSWWTSIYPFQEGKLQFLVNAQRIIGYTRYEPINRFHIDDQLWIPDVLSNIDCGSGLSAYEMGKSCANKIREFWSTDWAFIIFVVDSLNDADGQFTDGRFAYAVAGGPYLVVTYDNDGWGIENMGRVVAHEIGHIFWATDEYNGEKENSGYLYRPDMDGSGCIMDNNEWCISIGTKGQIGWVDENYNGHPDILENQLLMVTVKGSASVTDESPLTYEGYFTLQPYSCLRPACRSVTINKITQVTATGSIKAKDGVFDSPREEFTMSFTPPSAGRYGLQVEVRLRYVAEKVIVRWDVLYTYLIVVDSMRESSRPRVDVGSTEYVGFRLVWAHDNSPVTSGRIRIGDVDAMPRGEGWFFATVSSSSVGMSVYSVSQAEATIYTDLGSGTIRRAVIFVEPIEIIWDRVYIELFSERQRIDVGSEAPIRFRGYYQYDGSEFRGIVYIDRGLTQNSVGKYMYTVSSIEDSQYGLTAFTSNSIYVIFDKVVIYLTSPRARIDIGSTAPIQIEARYAYDSAPFQGNVILSESLTHNNVGLYRYRASGIIDELYGLTIFESNELPIIFDRVVIELQPVLERVQVGKPAEIRYRAYYEYDSQQFQGEIQLNEDVIGMSLGPIDYYVARIFDKLYGLQAFKTNTVTIIFDRIRALPAINVLTPFKMTVSVVLSFEYDGQPVRSASVAIASRPVGENTYSPGTYTLEYFTPLPYVEWDVTASKNGFDQIEVKSAQIHTGNTITYFIVTVSILIIVVIVIRKRKRQISKIGVQGPTTPNNTTTPHERPNRNNSEEKSLDREEMEPNPRSHKKLR
ncbi:MAG: hypothetical protein QW675_05730 [Nitrososphaerota archaeon]